MTAFNHYVYPESNHTLVNLLYDIKRSRPMLEIREQMFTDLRTETTIYVASKDDLTGRITDVSIIEKDRERKPGAAGDHRRLGPDPADGASNAMLLELHDGEIHDIPDPEQPDKYQVTASAARHAHGGHGAPDGTVRPQDPGRPRDEPDPAAPRLPAQVERRRGPEQHVATSVADVVQWQYRLLDPEEPQTGMRQEPATRAEAAYPC